MWLQLGSVLPLVLFMPLVVAVWGHSGQLLSYLGACEGQVTPTTAFSHPYSVTRIQSPVFSHSHHPALPRCSRGTLIFAPHLLLLTPHPSPLQVCEMTTLFSTVSILWVL